MRGAASHTLLTNEHIFLAFAQVEWDTFAEVMRDVQINPHTILQEVEEHLHLLPTVGGSEVHTSAATKLVIKLALHHASRAGRQASRRAICSRPSSRRRRACRCPSCGAAAWRPKRSWRG